MKNTVEYFSDGANLYVTFYVKSSYIGKIILTLMVVTLLVGFVLLASNISNDKNGRFFFPMVISLLLIVAFPIRYWFWNFFGKERLVINTKSVSYCYDYGIIQTNLKTTIFEELLTEIVLVKEDEDSALAKLSLQKIREDDGLQEIIFESSIVVSPTDLLEIEQEIIRLFVDEFNHETGFVPFSVN